MGTAQVNEVKVYLPRLVNRHFLPVLRNKSSRYLLMKGGAGSGKSHTAAQWCILKAADPRVKVLATRKYTPYVKLSCWPLIGHYLREWKVPHTEHRGELTYRIKGGGMILCKGLDESEKIKSIEGLTHVWMEEPTEFIAKDFINLDLRLRGEREGLKYQICLSFNPINRNTWVFTEFYTQRNPEALYHESNYKNNQFIDEAYRRRLERLAKEDENYYRIYVLNEWGEIGSVIYHRWEIRNLEYKSLRNDVPFLLGGLDFGFNEPSSFHLYTIKDRTVYVIDEVYESGLLNTELVDRVRGVYVKWNLHLDDVEIYADHEPDRIEEFNRNGFLVEPANKEVPVWAQIEFMKTFPIIISDRCPQFRKEIEGYKAKEDRKTGVVRDEPVAFRDHAMDEMRYAIYSRYDELLSDGEKRKLIMGGKSFLMEG